MHDYRVELDSYSGPLDLLLFLVRKHEINLSDIPIAELTDQYIAHLRAMQQIDMELAGDFLVMAATLLEIKSQMLMPRGEATDAAESIDGLDMLDPRYELVQQLLAYRRFKDAAIALDDRREQWQRRFALRPAEPVNLTAEADADHLDPDAASAPLEIDLEDVHVFDLCKAFADILESLGTAPGPHEVIYDDTPLALHAEDILDRLRRDAPDGGMTLQQMFLGRARAEAIGLFLAMLELVRQRVLRAFQDDQGAIRVELCAEPPEDLSETQPEAAERWRDPETGQMQYEWPDEEARQRADRRAELRAKHADPGSTAPGSSTIPHDAIDDTESAADLAASDEPVSTTHDTPTTEDPSDQLTS